MVPDIALLRASCPSFTLPPARSSVNQQWFPAAPAETRHQTKRIRPSFFNQVQNRHTAASMIKARPPVMPSTSDPMHAVRPHIPPFSERLPEGWRAPSYMVTGTTFHMLHDVRSGPMPPRFPQEVRALIAQASEALNSSRGLGMPAGQVASASPTAWNRVDNHMEIQPISQFLGAPHARLQMSTAPDVRSNQNASSLLFGSFFSSSEDPTISQRSASSLISQTNLQSSRVPLPGSRPVAGNAPKFDDYSISQSSSAFNAGVELFGNEMHFARILPLAKTWSWPVIRMIHVFLSNLGKPGPNSINSRMTKG